MEEEAGIKKQLNLILLGVASYPGTLSQILSLEKLGGIAWGDFSAIMMTLIALCVLLGGKMSQSVFLVAWLTH